MQRRSSTRASSLNDGSISWPPSPRAAAGSRRLKISCFSLNISRPKLGGPITSACDARRGAAGIADGPARRPRAWPSRQESRKHAQRRLRLIDADDCRGFNGGYEERPSFDGRRRRLLFERAKGRISIDGRCITSTNSIVLRSAVGAGLAIQARRRWATAHRATPSRAGRHQVHRRRQNGPAYNQRFRGGSFGSYSVCCWPQPSSSWPGLSGLSRPSTPFRVR